MALPVDAATRVDQLHADLRLVHRGHRAAVAVPDTAPMFTTHQDGSVWNRQGVQIRGPRSTK